MALKRSSTYRMKDGVHHQDHCEAVPNQKLPSMKGSNNTRKEYEANQGERKDGFDPSHRGPEM